MGIRILIIWKNVIYNEDTKNLIRRTCKFCYRVSRQFLGKLFINKVINKCMNSINNKSY